MLLDFLVMFSIVFFSLFFGLYDPMQSLIWD